MHVQSALFNELFLGLDHTSKNEFSQVHPMLFIPVPLLFASDSVSHRRKQNNGQNLRNQDANGENRRSVNVQVNR